MTRSVLREIRLIAGQETHLLLTNPSPIVILLIMPVVLIVFLKNGLVPPAVAGHQAANGTAQAVPGISVMFAFFVVGYAGFAFFREHGWHTWDRLRVSPLTTSGVVVGKALPYLAVGVLQILILLGVGCLFLDLSVRGSAWAILALVVLLCTSAVSLALLLTAFAHSIQHLFATANLAAVLLGGIGGAFAPVSTYPRWAQVLAHATPQFWAIEGFQQVIVGGASLAGVMVNLAVLFCFSAAFLVLAAWRFDITETKQSFLD